MLQRFDLEMKKLEEYVTQLQTPTDAKYKVKDCQDIQIVDEFVMVSCYSDAVSDAAKNFDAHTILLKTDDSLGKLQGKLTPFTLQS